jgi:hypothetical protein
VRRRSVRGQHHPDRSVRLSNMDRSASQIRFSRDRPAAEYRRTQLFARLPSHARQDDLECAIEKAFARNADNVQGLDALRAAIALPGILALKTPDRLAAIAALDGPVLDDEVAADRRWFAREVWKGVQAELTRALNRARAASLQEQADLLRGLVREQRMYATLLTEPSGHAVFALGWRPGEPRPLISYGRWRADNTRWGWVKSPDSIMRRAFRPVKNTVYAFTVYQLSVDDQRQLIEWLERAFAVNELAIGPERGRAVPLARSFVKYIQSMLLIAGKKHPAGGVVERGRARGGQLMQERSKP